MELSLLRWWGAVSKPNFSQPQQSLVYVFLRLECLATFVKVLLNFQSRRASQSAISSHFSKAPSSQDVESINLLQILGLWKPCWSETLTRGCPQPWCFLWLFHPSAFPFRRSSPPLPRAPSTSLPSSSTLNPLPSLAVTTKLRRSWTVWLIFFCTKNFLQTNFPYKVHYFCPSWDIKPFSLASCFSVNIWI